MQRLAILLLLIGCKKTEEALPGGVAVEERAVVPEPPTEPSWERAELAINTDASKPAKQPAVVERDGSPIFAWVEGSLVQVARWKNAGATFDGKGSLEMIGPLNRQRDKGGSEPRLAVGGDGALFAAWIEYDQDDHPQLEVARHASGSEWSSLGRANTKAHNPHAFDFAISSEGPVVAIYERSFEGQKARLTFRRFDGKAWTALGSDSSIAIAEGDDLTNVPAISADPTHPPLVVWKERKQGSPPFTVARRWDAGKASWIEIEAPAGADSDTELDADAGPGGAAYLWMTTNAGVTSIMRLDPEATRWTDLGEPKCGSNPQSTLDVAGAVAVIATEASLCAFVYDREWKLLGSGFSGKGLHVRDVVAAGSGPIFVAWQDISTEPAVIKAIGFISR